MTGQKDQYTTIEKLWELDDKTLKSSQHDEMVLWLLHEQNIRSVLPISNITDLIRMQILEKGHSKRALAHYIFKKQINIWECLRLNEPDAIDIDFTDELQLVWDEMVKDYNACREFPIQYDLSIMSEVPITTGRDFLVGYTDIKVEIISQKSYTGKYFEKSHTGHDPYYIEVKPTIKSFGETLRQLNTYKHYLHTDQLYLFTTDLRFQEAFKSQGIEVLTYPNQ